MVERRRLEIGEPLFRLPEIQRAPEPNARNLFGFLDEIQAQINDNNLLPENYDSSAMEEYNEEACPRFDFDRQPQSSVTIKKVRASRTTKSNNPKKGPEERRVSLEDEISDELKLSQPTSQWSYGEVGHRMQRRLKMKEPYESKLQREMIDAK